MRFSVLFFILDVDFTLPSSISRAVGCRPTGPGANPGAGTHGGDKNGIR